MLAAPKSTCLIGFNSDPLTALASISWTDVSDRLISFETRRGRSYELDRFEAGTARVRLENHDRALEPSYAGSPYHPNVVPLRPIQILIGENLVGNPRAAVDTTGWAAFNGGTVARSTTVYLVGGTSLAITGTVDDDGGRYDGSGLTVGASYVASALVKGSPGEAVRLSLSSPAATFLGQADLVPPDSGWHLLEVPFVAGEGGTYRVALTTQSDAQTFYAIAQLVQGTEAQPYVDAATPIITGFVSGWPVEWEGDYATVEVDCVDGMESFALADLAGFTRSAEASGTRVGAVLDDVGWPAADRIIDAGDATMAAYTVAASGNVKARTHLDEIQDAEIGAMFVDGSGRFVFQERNARTSPPYTEARLTFSDAAEPSSGELPCVDVKPVFDKLRIINEAIISRDGGATATATDATSRGRYGPRSVSRTLKIDADGGLQDIADVIVLRGADPSLRFDSIRVEGWLASNESWPTLLHDLLTTEISDRVMVKKLIANLGSPPSALASDVHIEGIEYRGERGRHIEATLRLSPVDSLRYLILDDATYGQLDEEVLGY